MNKTQTKLYRFITLFASFLLFMSIFNFNERRYSGEEFESVDDNLDENIVKLESISYSKAVPIINVKSVSSILKRESIGVNDAEFNYISPIKKAYLTIDNSLVELIGYNNYNRYKSLQVSEYNCNIYSFVNYFNIHKDFFTNLKLYPKDEVEILFSGNSQLIADLVVSDGAYYSKTRNTIYTVEWLNTATIDEILYEEISIEELKLISDKTSSVIESLFDFNSGKNYKSKILG